MVKRQILICGYKVDVRIYKEATYLYPSFNGNMEVRANHKGFRKLSSYLRFIRRYIDNNPVYNLIRSI